MYVLLILSMITIIIMKMMTIRIHIYAYDNKVIITFTASRPPASTVDSSRVNNSYPSFNY